MFGEIEWQLGSKPTRGNGVIGPSTREKVTQCTADTTVPPHD